MFARQPGAEVAHAGAGLVQAGSHDGWTQYPGEGMVQDGAGRPHAAPYVPCANDIMVKESAPK